MKVCKGTTRIVFLIGKYAVKLPRIYNWKMFLRGLVANMNEALFSGVWDELCPVRFSFPGGFMIIMDRAEPVDDVDLTKLPEVIVNMAETKPNNYGLLNNKLVAIDYG